jgi:iron complex outermembrane receptor protein
MTRSQSSLRHAVSVSLAMSATIAGAYASADESAGAPPQLQEIIITAQKRAEDLQDVPISVIAVSAQQLQDGGVKDIKDLAIITPGLTVTSEGNESITTARIRGIGTVGDNPGLESSVGIVIDGVYRPRNGVGFGDLGELEQIEILEGPQGELFGKNNDAGVINITTKRPSSTFAASAQLTGGNFNDREINASITGPLGDASAARLYVGYQKRDGWLTENTGLGPNGSGTTDNRNSYTLRGQYLFKPSSDLDLLVIADLSRRNESCCGAVPRYLGPLAPIVNAIAAFPFLGGNGGANGGIGTGSQNYQAWANQPITQNIRDYGFSGELHWNLGFGKLTSITAWRDNTSAAGNDVDYTGIDLYQEPGGELNQTDFKQFSQELRLAGKVGSLDWLGGAFYAHEILTPVGTLWAGENFQTYLSGVASAAQTGAPNFSLINQLTGNPGLSFLPGVSGYTDRYRQSSNSYALFTDETWSIMDALDLTGGLRYTTEKKSARSNFDNTDGGAACGSLLQSPGVAALNPASPEYQLLLGIGCYSAFNPLYNAVVTNQSITEHNLSGTAKLAYHLSADMMVYGSISNGYKAGGFNLARYTVGIAPQLDTAFPDETVVAYEVGFKSTSLDRTLRVNAALFDQRYKDFQLNTFNGIQFIVNSIPRVSSKGGDLDVAWAPPVRGLTVSLGAIYAYTNIDEFGAALADFTPANGLGPARANDRLSFAPRWSGTGSATYELPLGSALALRFIVDEKYNTSYNTGSDLDPRKIQGAYGLLDARVGIGSADGKWSLEAWSQNLLNKYTYQVAFDAPIQLQQIDAYPGAPRFFGVTARVKF